ncbi:MAG: metallophosphoesterase family protein, partial [Candidatus Ventricola sp.]|nr:metallophosphoesterase family protein [Candidatus Ventricola sp.]
MRVGVFSDSHGDHEALDELLERMGALDAVCFLGDVARDAEHLRERLAAMPNQPVLYAVRGNNDYYSTCTLPWDLLIELGGVRIYMTHGHRLVSLMNLAYKAQ